MRATRARAIVGIVLLAAFAGGGPPGPRSSDELFDAGCRSLAAGNPDQAVATLTEALALRPEHAACALRLAEAYAAAGRCDDGVRVLENLLARRADDVELRIGAARFLTRVGRAARAAELLADPAAAGSVEGALALADALETLGRVEEADRALERALADRPAAEPLWRAHVQLALRTGRGEAALERVAQAERRLGERAELHLLAAEAHAQLGRVLGACEVRAVPGGRAGQFAGDRLLLELREPPERYLCCPRDSAMFRLRRALDAGADEPRAHVLHARLWWRAGRPEVGLAILESRGPALFDHDPDALELAGELALACDRIGDFLRFARLRAARTPAIARDVLYNALVRAADRCAERGDAVLNAGFLRRALALRPEDAVLRLRLGDVEWELGNHRDAAGLYRWLLEHDGLHPQRARLLARLEETDGDAAAPLAR